MNLTQSITNRWRAGISQTRRISAWFKTISRSGPGKVMLADKIHNEVFNSFDCLSCANCCKSIPPILSKRDVKRISRSLGMTKTGFQSEYLTKDNDGDTVINQSPCPFLMEDNRCRIYEIRPSACKAYPHSGESDFFNHLSLHKRNVRYCPALFEIVRLLADPERKT